MALHRSPLVHTCEPSKLIVPVRRSHTDDSRASCLFFPAPRLRNTVVEGTDVATQKHEVQPVADPSGNVQVLSSTMQIHELSIEQPAVVAYLQSIDPGKQEIALVHAIEVGITELVARRARARAAHASQPKAKSK